MLVKSFLKKKMTVAETKKYSRFAVCGFNSKKCCPIIPFRKDDFEFLQQRFGVPEQFLSILMGTTARAFKHTTKYEPKSTEFCPSTCKCDFY